jgi:hypothetical protein
MADTDSDLGDGANQKPGDSDGSNVNTESEIVQKLLSRLDVVEQQQKALQGDKDRGVNEVRKDQKELTGQFAEIKELIEKYPDDAEWRFQVNRLLELQEPPKEPDDASKKKGLADPESKTDEVDPKLLEKYKINPQSPEYLAQVKAGLTGIEAVLATAVGAKPPEPKEGDATGASGGAGGAAVQAAQAVLKDQYTKALDEAQKEFGFLSPSQLQIIDDEFAKKGLE